MILNGYPTICLQLRSLCNRIFVGREMLREWDLTFSTCFIYGIMTPGKLSHEINRIFCHVSMIDKLKHPDEDLS